MKIDGLGVPQQPDNKAKRAKAAEKSEKAIENQKPTSDSIELSKTKKPGTESGYTREIQKGAQTEKNAKRDLTEVKNKTTNGYYDKPEARAKTSEKLIDSEDLKEVVDRYHISNYSKEILANTPEVRHEKVAEAKQKISEGFYNNSENFGAFADKIIKHFGI
ncbi:MAG: flagellar biosynthesis anti-sigma factor FlgM [candidate division Zixibacteria bacterium]|nr:flagellar biosynthesis anti-sigma factor FlgM [candidate division Zixibacteria bacterium]